MTRTKNKDGTYRHKGRHRHRRARTSPYASGQQRLDQFRGIDSTTERQFRLLSEGGSRLELIAEMEQDLDSALNQIVSVPKRDWTPQRLAVASGLSVSQVTRVFHDDPGQQRWQQFTRDLKNQSIGYGLTSEQSARVMALAPGHRYSRPSVGILRLARAMGITVDELVEILISATDHT